MRMNFEYTIVLRGETGLVPSANSMMHLKLLRKKAARNVDDELSIKSVELRWATEPPDVESGSEEKTRYMILEGFSLDP